MSKKLISLQSVIGGDNVASFVIRMVLLLQGEEDRITYRELHKMLKEMNEESKIHVIAFLRKIGSESENGWESLVLPLIEESWPVEKNFVVNQLL